MLKKKPLRVYVDTNVADTLETSGQKAGGLSANQVIAIAAYELTRAVEAGVPLWHALGRIAGDEGMQLTPGIVGALTAGKPGPKRAIPAAS